MRLSAKAVALLPSCREALALLLDSMLEEYDRLEKEGADGKTLKALDDQIGALWSTLGERWPKGLKLSRERCLALQKLPLTDLLHPDCCGWYDELLSNKIDSERLEALKLYTDPVVMISLRQLPVIVLRTSREFIDLMDHSITPPKLVSVPAPCIDLPQFGAAVSEALAARAALLHMGARVPDGLIKPSAIRSHATRAVAVAPADSACGSGAPTGSTAKPSTTSGGGLFPKGGSEETIRGDDGPLLEGPSSPSPLSTGARVQTG